MLTPGQRAAGVKTAQEEHTGMFLHERASQGDLRHQHQREVKTVGLPKAACGLQIPFPEGKPKELTFSKVTLTTCGKWTGQQEWTGGGQ